MARTVQVLGQRLEAAAHLDFPVPKSVLRFPALEKWINGLIPCGNLEGGWVPWLEQLRSIVRTTR
jgi:hypothetical protein